MPRVADSSVLYALFSVADAHHAKAKAAISDPDVIYVPTEILVETVHLMELRHTPVFALAALDYLLALPHLRIAEPVNVQAVRSVYAASRGSLSLADAFVVQTCRALALPALTFDRAIVDAAS